MTDAPATLSAATARLLTWLERFVLGALFLLFAWQHGHDLLLGGMVRDAGVIEAEGGAGFEAAALVHWLLLLFNLFVGLMLLLGRRPVRPPRTARELFVPLLATFLLMALNVATGAWGAVGAPLVPPAWRSPLASLAALSTALGYAIALWGALALGRSFGVYVAVREVVLRGAYRWVRHPIYTGYLFVVLGLVLAEPRVLTLAVGAAFVLVMVYRARLEERALGDASEAYRRYRSEVGFLLPRLRRPPPASGG
jgi:protein-S-isoprenylcysteine O-methyltransferase Ste14